MLGVVKFVPVLKALPPVKDPYHETVPAQPLAVMLTVPVPHLLPPVLDGGIGIGFTVIVTTLLKTIASVDVFAPRR